MPRRRTYSAVVIALAAGAFAAIAFAAAPYPVGVYQINCGMMKDMTHVRPFVHDRFFTGGAVKLERWPKTIDTSGVATPPPGWGDVYKWFRHGRQFSYVFPKLTPGAPYSVVLHFADTWNQHPGQRIFGVAINGTQVLADFDIVAATGARDKAIVKRFITKADGSGRIIIQFGAVKSEAEIGGIEIYQGAGN